MKRQFIVRIQDLDSVLPDFGLGCYLVKANTKYTISMRVEIPKTYNLIIDFWSYDDVRVELLNRTISQNKEISQSFHTYPKTKYFFMTFKLELDISEKIINTYYIHYINIESMNPVIKNVDAPFVPNNYMEHIHNLDIECHPKNLMELDLENPFKNLKLPINFDLFETPLLKYMLKYDNSIHFFNALSSNINSCNMTVNLHKGSLNNIRTIDLIELRQRIMSLYEDLELKLTQIDTLIDHKKTIETKIESNPTDTEYKKNMFGNKILFLNRIIQSLNLKHNYIKNLMSNENKKFLKPNDIHNLWEILNYYEVRVLEDTKIIQTDLDKELQNSKIFEHEILSPYESRISQQQRNLDDILSSYRKLQSNCIEIKNTLDELVTKFILNWYQWLLDINYKYILDKIN